MAGESDPEKMQLRHNWEKMIQGVQDHVRGLNWGYKVALREKAVTYKNEYAKFTGRH